MILGVKDAAPWTDVLKVGLLPAPAMPDDGPQGCCYMAGHAVPDAAVAQCSDRAQHLSSPAGINICLCPAGMACITPAVLPKQHGPCMYPNR